MAKLLIGNVKGPTGAQGPTGPTGPQGPIGPSGKGVPAGGTDGQSLVKDGLDNYAARWEMRAKAVNESQVDEDGVIRLDRVPYAENLYDTSAQESVGEYIARTAGGNVSIADGDAWVTKLAGRRIHTGYTPESINMTVTPAARGEGESGIQAVLDRDTFVAYVATSGTITLTFTTAWSADPTLYGITVTGTPISGDEIVIVYVKEVRGTITHSNPTAFIETGWNLYDHSTGYARALKYSNVFGFMIGGAYTKLEFATSTSGPWEEITPDDGLFDVPSDGWLKVTGGNNSTTYILMTWSDWDEGYEGEWKAYSESKINLSTIMTSRFPYGLMQVGSVHDTIELGMQKTISRVERKAYNAANLAAAKASGRQYEYDENYIYIERETPVENVFVLSNKVTACDHGLEIVETTTVPVYIESMYGQNLKEKLTHDLPNAIAANSDAIANIATVISGTTNNSGHAISAGEYFIANGAKYKASATIDTSATWSDKSTSVSDHDLINALNSKIQHYYDTDGKLYRLPSNADLDSVTESGRYYFGSNVTNKPSSNGGYLDVYVYDTSWIKQVAYLEGSNAMYVRTKTGSSWISWVELALDSNIAKRPYAYYAEPTFTDGVAEIPTATIQTAIGITTFSHVVASLESTSVVARNNYIVGAGIQSGNVKIVCADSSKNGALGICMLIW